MRNRLPFALILSLFLSGCAQLSFLEKKTEGVVKSPDELVEQADKMVEKGLWREAIDMLRRGQKQHTESQLLRDREQALAAEWRDISITIEHKILIVETNALNQRLRLMELLSKGESNDYILKTRLLFWKQALKQKANGLVACSDYQLDKKPSLSELCLNLAAEIERTPAVEHRLARFDMRKLEQQALQVQESDRFQGKTLSKRRRGARAPSKKQQAVDREKRLAKVELLLSDAESAISNDDFSSAVKNLKEVAGIQPESGDYWVEIERVKLAIEQQIDKLVRQGEVYYGYDQLEEAVSTWEDVLVLDPDRVDIAERINRARKVMLKLKTIQNQSGV